jgi:para-aminobenzoate synthetase
MRSLHICIRNFWLPIFSLLWHATTGFTSLEFLSSTASAKSSPSRPHTAFFSGQNSNQEQKYDLTLLLIDHYDSFTYNLYDMLSQLTVKPPIVLAKDAYDSFPSEEFKDIDGIILSPGPGSPQTQPQFSKQAIRKNPDLPLLGVCLGHQLMTCEYGGDVGSAPTPIHGQDHRIYKTNVNSTIFDGLPDSWRVVRYHSLAAKMESFPECLEITAYSEDDNVIQGLQHKTNPHYGVQFHPESIGTEYGIQLLENFCKLCQDKKDQITDDMANLVSKCTREEDGTMDDLSSAQLLYDVYIHEIGNVSVDPQQVFDKFYKDQSYAMWIDSADERGNISILSAPTDEGRTKEYFIDQVGNDDNILSWLQKEQGLPTTEVQIVQSDLQSCHTVEDADAKVPFDFRGGHLGYLGYEVRYDTQRFLEKQEHSQHKMVRKKASSQSKVPSAAFFLAERSLVYHHPTKRWYMVGVSQKEDPEGRNEVLKWMKVTSESLLNLQNSPSKSAKDDKSKSAFSQEHDQRLAFVPNRSRETYEDNIKECHRQIWLGESYELCLTNQLEAEVSNSLSPFELYKILRSRNPAPYSAFFNWNKDRSRDRGSVAICCSSPERFIGIRRQDDCSFQAEAKPIKGTSARVAPKNGVERDEAEEREDNRRARALELSIKDRAENLMIVDLLRNDMSRVCNTGSVHVAKLMAIESYTTVHQMVSTIRGTLDIPRRSSVDLLRACFPGGSMTGAPKLRTMELLEELEDHVDRGPYSGSLGYLSLNGCMDMNIIIRTAVIEPIDEKTNKVSVGAGGAITALSDSKDEYEEMLLKSRAVVNGVQEWSASAQAPGGHLALCEKNAEPEVGSVEPS